MEKEHKHKRNIYKNEIKKLAQFLVDNKIDCTGSPVDCAIHFMNIAKYRYTKRQVVDLVNEFLQDEALNDVDFRLWFKQNKI